MPHPLQKMLKKKKKFPSHSVLVWIWHHYFLRNVHLCWDLPFVLGIVTGVSNLNDATGAHRQSDTSIYVIYSYITNWGLPWLSCYARVYTHRSAIRSSEMRQLYFQKFRSWEQRCALKGVTLVLFVRKLNLIFPVVIPLTPVVMSALLCAALRSCTVFLRSMTNKLEMVQQFLLKCQWNSGVDGRWWVFRQRFFPHTPQTHRGPTWRYVPSLRTVAHDGACSTSHRYSEKPCVEQDREAKGEFAEGCFQ